MKQINLNVKKKNYLIDLSLKSMIAIHQCTPKCTGTQIKSYENKSTFFVHLRRDCGPSLISLE